MWKTRLAEMLMTAVEAQLEKIKRQPPMLRTTKRTRSATSWARCSLRPS
jgi:hypothetical protein